MTAPIEKFRCGHPKSEENTYRFNQKPWSGSTVIQRGERCRICMKARYKRIRDERAAGRPIMTPSEVARLGGLKVSSDRAHMAEMGKKGGASVSKNIKHMAKIGSKGGSKRAANLKILKTTLTTLALMLLGACSHNTVRTTAGSSASPSVRSAAESIQDQLEVFQKKRWIRIQRDEQERQYYRRQRELICPETDKSKCL